MPARGYYAKYTKFVNANSGLDPLSPGQVRTILKADRKMQPHGRYDHTVNAGAGEVQCTARSKATGERCRRASSLGGNVCIMHGAAAPQTRAKAQRRLQQAADVLVQRLLSFALDGNVADPVAMQAINSALDRAGLKAGIDVDVTLKPFQQIYEAMESGTRASYRGEPELPELLDAIEREPEQIELEDAEDDSVIDVEVVDTIHPG
jgi:hypothetical protein